MGKLSSYKTMFFVFLQENTGVHLNCPYDVAEKTKLQQSNSMKYDVTSSSPSLNHTVIFNRIYKQKK